MHACADTGADVNIISKEGIDELHYDSWDGVPPGTCFQLANGRSVEPIGQIDLKFWVGTSWTHTSSTWASKFYILASAAEKVILGASFLEQTKIMLQHKSWLVEVPRPAFKAFSVCSVGFSRKHLLCDINHEAVFALPDSGSEVDLVSVAFAANCGLDIHPCEEAIQLADGSITISHGFFRTTVSIGTDFDLQGAPRSKLVAVPDFLILEELVHDVIIGDQTLKELRVFNETQHALIERDMRKPAAVNVIRLADTVDKVWKRFKSTHSQFHALQYF
ncbi:hypothetical protein N0V95_008900 [Ascochyta clinopodiicola]|nr:hypothetical protein N0V95_008900 [Ascochyta clinopodiicola]